MAVRGQGRCHLPRPGARSLQSYAIQPSSLYRLSIRKESPDFRLVALAPAPPSFDKDKREAQFWTPFLRRGDSIPIKVLAFRRDNFGGDIELNAENLPTGVTANPVTLAAGQTSALLMLHATDKAGDWFGPLRIIGKANIGTNMIVREARGGSGRLECARLQQRGDLGTNDA